MGAGTALRNYLEVTQPKTFGKEVEKPKDLKPVEKGVIKPKEYKPIEKELKNVERGLQQLLQSDDSFVSQNVAYILNAGPF